MDPTLLYNLHPYTSFLVTTNPQPWEKHKKQRMQLNYTDIMLFS